MTKMCEDKLRELLSTLYEETTLIEATQMVMNEVTSGDAMREGTELISLH